MALGKGAANGVRIPQEKYPLKTDDERRRNVEPIPTG
jgi:hypothetical protein